MFVLFHCGEWIRNCMIHLTLSLNTFVITKNENSESMYFLLSPLYGGKGAPAPLPGSEQWWIYTLELFSHPTISSTEGRRRKPHSGLKPNLQPLIQLYL